MSDRNFTYKSCGTNKEGNRYCARDYGYGPEVPNSNTYHYSNLDGSYYYSNPDGSTYYNNGQGGSTYTAPSGERYSSGYGNSAGGSASNSGGDGKSQK